MFLTTVRKPANCQAAIKRMEFKGKSGAILTAERKSASPASFPTRSELEKMARRRYQRPSLEEHHGQWTVRLRRDIYNPETETVEHKQVREVIADLDVPKRQALKLLDTKLEEINQQPITLGAAVTFKRFVNDIYMKILPLKSKSHASRYRGILNLHLLPALGAFRLYELEQQSSMIVQEFFVQLKARKFAAETYDKIRDCLSSVFNLAIEKAYMKRNPALARSNRNPVGIVLPQGRPTPKQKPVITVKQFEKLVQLIPEPYATMTFVAVFTGLRVSELIALRWNDLQDWAITIDEKCCRGEWGAPKSESSNATIGVLRKVIARVRALKQMEVQIGGGRGGYQTFKLVKRSGPEDLVFQGVRSGRAMRDNNILSRHLKPAARQLGLGFVNWRCLRTSHATWLKQAGVPLKDASFQMRHSRTSITADIYEQTPEEDQVLALEKLEKLTEQMAVN